MVGGFVVGIVGLRIMILAKFLGMKLMFTVTKNLKSKPSHRAISISEVDNNYGV